MATTVWPPIPTDELAREEDAALVLLLPRFGAQSPVILLIACCLRLAS